MIMRKFRFSHIILFCTMGLAALGAVALKPTQKLADQREKINLETMIPAQFGDWHVDAAAGAQVLTSPDVQANLDKIYDQILNRTYVNGGGDRVMLAVTYGSSQTQDLKAHRQEVCYAAQGFQISALSHEVLRLFNQAVPVTRMLAVKGERKESVTYWFTMGDEVVLSRTERMMVQLKYSFAGVIPDGMLVRVSNLTPNQDDGYRVHIEFLDKLMHVLDKKAMSKLLGIG
jgi:EpsI family protein